MIARGGDIVVTLMQLFQTVCQYIFAGDEKSVLKYISHLSSCFSIKSFKIILRRLALTVQFLLFIFFKVKFGFNEHMLVIF